MIHKLGNEIQQQWPKQANKQKDGETEREVN